MTHAQVHVHLWVCEVDYNQSARIVTRDRYSRERVEQLGQKHWKQSEKYVRRLHSPLSSCDGALEDESEIVIWYLSVEGFKCSGGDSGL